MCREFVFRELPYPEAGKASVIASTMPILISLEHAHIKWLQNITGMGIRKKAIILLSLQKLDKFIGHVGSISITEKQPMCALSMYGPGPG